MIIKRQRKNRNSIDDLLAMQHSDRWYQHPVFVSVFLVCFIYATEYGIDLLLFWWPTIITFMDINTFHAAMVALCIIPALYVMVLRPQATLHDQRRLLTNALKSSHENFESTVSKSVDGILVLDHKGIIKYVNPAAEQLLQKRSQDLLGILFGFTASAGEVSEIDFLSKNLQIGTAEMRVQKTDWHGKQAMLVSLRDISETVRLREQLIEQSMTDELTGLHNRRSFLLLAEQQIKLVTRTKAEMFIIFMDLDRFKHINDTLGHQAGDQALIDMSKVLNQVFRDSDIVSRIGGDEFLVLTVNADKCGIDRVINRLKEAINDHNQTAGRPYKILISYGVAHHDVIHPVALTDLIEYADQQMYEQKQAKNQAT